MGLANCTSPSGPSGHAETDTEVEPLPVTTETTTPVPTECNDVVDNDGDGLTDWQFDLGCTGPDDPTEGGLSNALDNGWTVFEERPNTSIFYVSSAVGDDGWSGLAPEWDGVDGPKRTVSAALELLQDGKPDWLLFRRGDTWEGETLGVWQLSGESEEAPIVISSYGDSMERPRFEVIADTWFKSLGDGSPEEQRAHLRILGLHIINVSKDPDDERFTGSGGSCLQWLGDGGDVLLEDIRCDYAQLNLQSDPTLPFTVRRSVFNGNYSLTSHAQSAFTSIAAPLLFEENLFHHGGWSDVFRLGLWNAEPDSTVWSAIDDGRFGIDLDGTHYDIDGVDLTGAADMQMVAAVLEESINAEAGPGVVDLRYSTLGGAFQLRAPSLPSGPDYAITAYSAGVAGTDLDLLFDLTLQGSPESTILNRNMYLAYGYGNTTVRGNIDANGASGGLQLRMGGVAEGNLFLRNPHAIVVGSFLNAPDAYVSGELRDNVVLGSRDIDTQVQGRAFLIESHATTQQGGHSLIRDVEVTGNVVAHQQYGTGNITAITLSGTGPHDTVSVHDNVVYDWARPSWHDPMDQRTFCIRADAEAGSTEVLIYDNLFQQPNGGFLARSDNDAVGVSLFDNTYHSSAPDPPDAWSRGWFQLAGSVAMDEWTQVTGDSNPTVGQVTFVDADRDVDSYMGSLDQPATYEAFIAATLSQSRFNWQPEYTAEAVNAYVREGFTPTN